jgi:phosphonate transport system ATP-binding protein
MRVIRSSTRSSVTDLDLKKRPFDRDARAGVVDTAPVSSVGVPAVDIEAHGVAKSFGDNRIFSDVSFRLERGASVALVGANGAGKSTLLRCIMGLIPVSAGSVRLLGQDATGAKAGDLRRLRARVGLVSQKHNLVPRLSVLSNVIHGLLGQEPGLRHWSQTLAPATSRAAAMAALDSVGLADFAARRADRLSGGQSQRVAIARALVSQPKVLFADEPTASLDPAAGEDVMDLFFQLAREHGVTVVFTSHNIEHALHYGDRILGLADGALKLDAAAATLTTSDLRGLYD